MRRKYIGLTVALSILVVLLAAWLFFPQPSLGKNDLKGVAIFLGQEEFARQYEVGLLFEKQGSWEAAQEAYGEAALAEQTEIQKAAEEGLSRVLVAENNWRLTWRSQWASIFIWAIQMSFLVVLIWLIFSFIWLLRTIRKPHLGYLIQPVQDFTKDALGDGLHYLLVFHLQAVKRAQNNAERLLRAQSLAIGQFPTIVPWEEMTEEVTRALSVLDKVKVVGIDVSLRPFVQTLQFLWRKQKYTLRSQIHQRGNRLLLHVEVYHYQQQASVFAWDIEGDSNLSLAEQKESIICEWAYRLLADHSNEPTSSTSWRTLGAYSEGLLLWQKHQRDGRFTSDLLYQATQKFNEARTIEPDFKPAQVALGTIYNTQGYYEKAEIIFQDLVHNTGPSHLLLQYNLGVSYYHQVEKGRWAREKAAEQFLAIQNKLEKQADSNEYEQSLLALTYSGLAMICALEVYYKNNASEWVLDQEIERLTAVKVYTTKSRKIASKIIDETIQRIVLASANHADGFAYLQDKKFESARDSLKRAIQENPENPIPYANLAMTYEKGSEQAIVWLKKSVTIQPGFAFGWYQLGEAYYKNKSNPNSREWAREAFYHAIEFADAQDRLGTLAFKDGNYELAMQHYTTAVSINSRKEYIWRNMAWRTLEAIELGWISFSQDRIQDALDWANQALELASENKWQAYDIQGWAFHMLGLENDALQALDISIELHESAQNLFHRAQVYSLLNDIDRLQNDINEAKKCKDYKIWASAISKLQAKFDK